MFEKSLVDLIRGLRSHKGNEGEYIQGALKECRGEIRSQDLDVKATALLKLIYLEMFGYDMAWAAFNVLEVMASPKIMQKRVGYLAAVQSFRPETEVLMLAENLLKKDLTSPSIPVLSLPLTTLPHIITSSLALSILSDLLPRLSHSQPAVRKKTIVTLYRLALVYPETLRVAWPKIKERLLDEQEDSSVTAATVNVVCELGWRRPQDFLALAPRLFDLLLAQKNNWMGIKIIKLFAVLTPLEPRLVKKLVRPLTKLIQETTAMSLLYECISGIVQGGILDGAESGVDVEDVADLCISKLRGMIVLDGDPNLKYVALLAFNKIVGTHPGLVSMQQDVIMACLDDPDISIKMQALELVSGMINSDSLQGVVNRLMKQLANSPSNNDANGHSEEGLTDMEQRLVPDKRGSENAHISDEYRQEIISRILDMCSKDTYANITDFEWYIEILVHLVRHLPADKETGSSRVSSEGSTSLGGRIGGQLRDVAVRVKELRPETIRAAETLVLMSNRTIVYARHGGGQSQVLQATVWICGEFAEYLSYPYELLNSLIHESTQDLSWTTLAISIQAIPKIISHIALTTNREWNVSRGTTMSLMLARATEFLEKLSSHPNLEVQERSVEFLELLRLASEALSNQASDSNQAPLLLTSAIPGLFTGMELNPVSAAAQSKVPVPLDLDLDTPINSDLPSILQASQVADEEDSGDDVYHSFYHDREPAQAIASLQPQPAARRLDEATENEPLSYQSAPDSPATLARRKAERLARARDDPFYIAPSDDTDPRIHDIISKTNGDEELDVDAIPIIDLHIDSTQARAAHDGGQAPERSTKKKKPARKFVVAADETLESQSLSGSRPTSHSSTPSGNRPRSLSPSSQHRGKATVRPVRSLLTVDSSTLQRLTLEGPPESEMDILRREAEEAEMAIALREVERKRLEMQREIERKQTIIGEGVDAEGTVVRRKKKKRAKVADEPTAEQQPEEGVVKKKKKKKVKTKSEGGLDAGGEATQEQQLEPEQDAPIEEVS
ncbi:AP-3 complex subunit delta [Elasticomyces elasticus]|uniref:AP-3 complex subunit delta n=1 Tax=Exophiala sideris TaxID=1016849 RepID=A0ABR0J1Y5_9EURO|nr:AP-3 complex subunit delta [Elasticomyces elasticus]KAK5024031.1 AP-3 complex subunit delta [Exophiala sideris]KAK5029107.1 AP-3 complex subunit delta [Exophiala sideris]KAK5054743.1 AP-3 complex subunit delta [Exophiala sideris]KAK5178930.1 AP-3 complex subunit delta [Eurotiomycetes sp. CCFEE 6388]